MGIFLDYKSIILPRSMNVSCNALIFFYTGYLYHKVERKIPLNFFYAIFCVLIVCGGTYLGKMDFVKDSLAIPFVLLFIALTGIYFNLYISEKLAQKNIKLLSFIGENTIIIMALHFTCFKIINLIQVILYNYPGYMIAHFPVLYANDWWWILYSLVGVIIPLIIKKHGIH